MAGTELDLTPTERRIMAMLGDGERHLKEELRTCLWDEYASVDSVRPHIMRLRAKMPEGKLILCEVKGRTIYYRLVYRFNSNWVPAQV
jgi:DNA-binding response OmpR family regulator